MKKKWVILGTAMMAAVAITACGSKDTTATTVAVETTAEAASDTAAPESQAGTTEAGSGTTAAEGESGSVAGEESKAAGDAADETVNTGDEADDVSEQAEDLTAEEIKTFAGKVQKAVADKDIKALADLCAYPVYVSLSEGEGSEIDNKEAFIALDTAKLFTESMLKEIAETDPATLEQFGAGVIMGNENNIIFNNVDGQPSITGINLK
ncbi:MULTISPECIES: hypothetical protein [Enterocloster]|uniref:Uncharacterized protein n=1 Tax=Enterocloster lavalensis TaxID=460384 RepID=A0A1I0GPY8_9FIRM|nr:MULTISPECIES: hypothetical protein [Enterocloster]MDR3756871.1 hypothetical protein [Enterocloster sp.]PST30037.1 hypothetical protein C7256_26765 [Enterocloster lavalensis]SET73142.1 hypothetical protein SAMN05216313_112141 [Enterocloster lavalensis]